MINWNTVPATYNDSLSYMEMLGKCITVCQQLFDRVGEIEIDSEQISINKEDISYLKDSVYALAERVDDIAGRVETLETLTAGRTTPEYQLLTSGDITVDDNIFRVTIPESLRGADAYIISFTMVCTFSGVQYTQNVMMLVHTGSITAYTTYVHTTGGDEPIKLNVYDLAPTDTYIALTALSDAIAYDVYTIGDTGAIVAFWENPT